MNAELTSITCTFDLTPPWLEQPWLSNEDKWRTDLRAVNANLLGLVLPPVKAGGMPRYRATITCFPSTDLGAFLRQIRDGLDGVMSGQSWISFQPRMASEGALHPLLAAVAARKLNA